MKPTTLVGTLVLVALSSCDGAFAHRSDEELKGALDLPKGVRRVVIEIDEGSVTVFPVDPKHPDQLVYHGLVRRMADRGEVLEQLDELSAAFVAQPLDAEGTLRIEFPKVPQAILDAAGKREGTDSESAKMVTQAKMWLPDEIAFEVRTGRGHLKAQGRKAHTHLETGAGDVRIVGCNGLISGRTRKGNFLVNEHRGSVDLESDRGMLFVYVEELGDKLRVHSGDGTIQVRVPANASFEGRAQAEKGKVKNGFGLDVVQKGPLAVMEGKVGSGECKLDVATQQGYVSIATLDY